MKRILPGDTAMNPVTAFGLALAGFSLWLHPRSPAGATEARPVANAAGQTLAALVVAIGLIELGSVIAILLRASHFVASAASL